MARTVVVTGGASGIGRVIAERFANAGYGVHIFDIDAEAVAMAQSDNAAFSGTVGDVSVAADVEADFLRFISMRSKVAPQDIADMAVFLCSEGASRVTGQVIAVDGHSEWER